MRGEGSSTGGCYDDSGSRCQQHLRAASVMPLCTLPVQTTSCSLAPPMHSHCPRSTFAVTVPCTTFLHSATLLPTMPTLLCHDVYVSLTCICPPALSLLLRNRYADPAVHRAYIQLLASRPDLSKACNGVILYGLCKCDRGTGLAAVKRLSELPEAWTNAARVNASAFLYQKVGVVAWAAKGDVSVNRERGVTGGRREPSCADSITCESHASYSSWHTHIVKTMTILGVSMHTKVMLLTADFAYGTQSKLKV